MVEISSGGGGGGDGPTEEQKRRFEEDEDTVARTGGTGRLTPGGDATGGATGGDSQRQDDQLDPGRDSLGGDGGTDTGGGGPPGGNRPDDRLDPSQNLPTGGVDGGGPPPSPTPPPEGGGPTGGDGPTGGGQPDDVARPPPGSGPGGGALDPANPPRGLGTAPGNEPAEQPPSTADQEPSAGEFSAVRSKLRDRFPDATGFEIDKARIGYEVDVRRGDERLDLFAFPSGDSGDFEVVEGDLANVRVEDTDDAGGVLQTDNPLIAGQIRNTWRAIRQEFPALRAEDYEFVVGGSGQVDVELTETGETLFEQRAVRDQLDEQFAGREIWSTDIQQVSDDAYTAEVEFEDGGTATELFAFSEEAAEQFQTTVTHERFKDSALGFTVPESTQGTHDPAAAVFSGGPPGGGDADGAALAPFGVSPEGVADMDTPDTGAKDPTPAQLFGADVVETPLFETRERATASLSAQTTVGATAGTAPIEDRTRERVRRELREQGENPAGFDISVRREGGEVIGEATPDSSFSLFAPPGPRKEQAFVDTLTGGLSERGREWQEEFRADVTPGEEPVSEQDVASGIQSIFGVEEAITEETVSQRASELFQDSEAVAGAAGIAGAAVATPEPLTTGGGLAALAGIGVGSAIVAGADQAGVEGNEEFVSGRDGRTTVVEIPEDGGVFGGAELDVPSKPEGVLPDSIEVSGDDARGSEFDVPQGSDPLPGQSEIEIPDPRQDTGPQILTGQQLIGESEQQPFFEDDVRQITRDDLEDVETFEDYIEQLDPRNQDRSLREFPTGEGAVVGRENPIISQEAVQQPEVEANEMSDVGVESIFQQGDSLFPGIGAGGDTVIGPDLSQDSGVTSGLDVEADVGTAVDQATVQQQLLMPRMDAPQTTAQAPEATAPAMNPPGFGEPTVFQTQTRPPGFGVGTPVAGGSPPPLFGIEPAGEEDEEPPAVSPFDQFFANPVMDSASGIFGEAFIPGVQSESDGVEPPFDERGDSGIFGFDTDVGVFGGEMGDGLFGSFDAGEVSGPFGPFGGGE